ncbi:MAG: hypothetical protein AAGD04_00780 [Pseudomonadota bacterium]
MQPDQYLVLGLIITVLSIPSLVSAYSEGRAPRLGAMFFVVGGGMIAYAANQKPTGYSLNEIPQIFMQVVGAYI